jgi:hypothetical protein
MGDESGQCWCHTAVLISSRGLDQEEQSSRAFNELRAKSARSLLALLLLLVILLAAFTHPLGVFGGNPLFYPFGQ